MNNFESVLERLRSNDPSLTSLKLAYTASGHSRVTTNLDSFLLDYDLDDDEIHRLITALINNRILTFLTLSCIPLQPELLSYLSNMLTTNTTITSLNLTGCSCLNDVRISYLASMLKVNTTLTSLNLSYNMIHNDGFHSLATALTTNTTLKFLSLKANPISKYDYLSTALTVNTTLTSLDLSFITMDPSKFRNLKSALMFNTSLTSIGFRNDITDKILARNKHNMEQREITLYEILFPQL